MFKLLDKIPLLALGVMAAFMAVAPLRGEPHLLEKTRMLFEGNLSRPIDIFDLFLHSIFLVLFLLKLIRMATRATENKPG